MEKEPAMNIIHHHRTQGVGAEGVHISQIINGFKIFGHTVDVVCPLGENSETYQKKNAPATIKAAMRNAVISCVTNRLPQVFFELVEMGYNWIAYFKLCKLLKTKKIDLIYERHAFYLTAGAKVAEQYNIPFIVEVNEIAGHKRVRGQVLTAKARNDARNIFARASAIIVVSKFLKTEIERMGIAADKIHILPNGVNAKHFDPANYDQTTVRKRYGIPDKSVVIGFVGWLVEWHKLDLLLESFAIVSKDANCRLVLVGNGKLYHSLQELTQKLGIDDKVVFTGAVPHSEIPSLIKAFDICAVPGSNDYRSPIKMFEYMAMGKCVVAPDCEPITCIIQDNHSGAIFKPNHVDTMAYSLTKLINDERLRNMIGENARKQVIEKHLWQHNAERILEIYTDCIENKSRLKLEA